MLYSGKGLANVLLSDISIRLAYSELFNETSLKLIFKDSKNLLKWDSN